MTETLKMGATDKYIVPGLERGLRILSEFSRDDSMLSAPELARRLEIPRSTVFRLLSTLESLGFVEREPGGRDYSLGMAVLRLGFECLASKELTELGRPILDRLRDQIGYSCNMVVRDGRSVVYVCRSAVASPFANMVYVGTRLPAHSTLFGRVLLRDLTYNQLHDLYPEEQLHQATEKTPATVDELFKLIQSDKEHDFVFEPGYYEESIATLVVPVYGRRGAVISAIGVTLPSAHIEKLELQALSNAACNAASELSQLLDHIVPGTDISATHKRGNND